MTSTILTKEDHVAYAIRYQDMAYGYSIQQEEDREAGLVELSIICQEKAAKYASKARFHLMAALDAAQSYHFAHDLTGAWTP